MALRPQRPQDVQTAACPCRHGDVPAETAGQRPLLERAAAGDREAFALVYDNQVEGIYRYLLAWTGTPTEAADLTTQVFHSAIGWLPPTTTGPEGEAAAWLIAMARDAIAQHQPSVKPPGFLGTTQPGGPAGPSGPVVRAVTRLVEPEREVVVLRLLLGHSLDHTAHLSGYSRRAAMELQLAACLALHNLTASPTPPEPTTPPSAEEFERRLGRWEVDLTATNPPLADALSAAASLRQAIPGYIVAPTAKFVTHLRATLVTGSPPAGGTPEVLLVPGSPGAPAFSGSPGAPVLPGSPGAPVPPGSPGAPAGPVDSPEHHPLRSATLPLRGPQQPEVADSAARSTGGGSPAAPSPAAPSPAAPSPDLLPPAVLSLGPESWVESLADPPSAGPLPDQSSATSTTVAAASTGPGSGAAGGPGPGGTGIGGWLSRRPWVATGVATAGVVVVLAVQAFGGPGGPPECEGRPCPAPTTVVAAGGGSSVGTPLTTVVEPSTTSSTVAGGLAVVPPTAAPRTSAATVPPSSRPATTAPPTTARPTTTTVPPTTAPPTTTTAAPVPT